MKRKRIYTISIVLSVLLLPSFLYVVLATGKHHIEALEIIGPVESISQDPHMVPVMRFRNYNGDSISTVDFDHDIVVYNFFCLSCSDSSARNVLEIKTITSYFSHLKDIKYVSMNLVPSQWSDSAVVAYVDPLNVDTKNWFFVNADPVLLSKFAQNGLLINSQYDPVHKPYGPGMATVVIVDKDQHIRSYLDGNQYVDQSHIIDVIKHIRLEEFQKNAKPRADNFEKRRYKK